MLKDLKSSIAQCSREITDQELDLILETVKMFTKFSQISWSQGSIDWVDRWTASFKPGLGRQQQSLFNISIKPNYNL